MKFPRLVALIGLIHLLLLGTSVPTLAASHGFAGFAVNPALSSINGFDASMDPFVNKMKMGQSFQSHTAITYVYPNNLLAGSNLPNGTITSNLSFSAFLASNYFEQYVLSLRGTVGGAGFLTGNGTSNQQGQVYAIGGGTTISGCSNGNVPPCYFQSGLTVTGTNPQVTLDLSAPITGATNNGSGLVRLALANTSITVGMAVTVSGVAGSDGNGCGANVATTVAARTSTTVDLTGTTFPGGCTYTSGGQLFQYQSTANDYSWIFNYAASSTWSGMSSKAICKLADFNVDNTCNTTAGHSAWAGGFNDDFLAKITPLSPAFIRFLDVNLAGAFRPAADFAGWQTPSAWSYGLGSDFWDIPDWFGSDSGTNSYSIACSNGQACTYLLTGGAPANGDFIQFFNVNANTSATPTIQITDANSVTSSAIPLLDQAGAQAFVNLGGSGTLNDTISFTFNTTPVSAGTCLSGGAHTTSAYTVPANGTPLGTIQAALVAILQADTTLTAENANIEVHNPFNGSTQFQLGWANQACIVTVAVNVTGAASETFSIGPMPVGNLRADTLYSAAYSKLLGGFVVGNEQPANGPTPVAGGQDVSWPWIVQLQLAKALSQRSGVQIGCWLQVSLFWSDASFTSLANLANANQCPGGTGFELANEVWNSGNYTFEEALYLANSVGLGQDNTAYYELRQRQLWAIASSIFGGLSGNLHTNSEWLPGFMSIAYLNGTGGQGLCGTTGCGTPNQAYQNAIGVNYNSSPNRPADFTRHIGQAMYYIGAVSGNYTSAASYGSWSASGASVAGNILTVPTNPTGTIWWNNGISGCSGAYLAAPTITNPVSFQLTGTVTTTLNGAMTDNQTTIPLTSVTGVQVGMGIYNQTNNTIVGTVGSINTGAKSITVAASTHANYRSAGSNDTIVFFGLAGTYQLNSTTCFASAGTITGGDVLGFQYAIDNYNGLNSALGNAQDAYNWMYQDTLVAAFDNYMPSQKTIASFATALYQINGVAINAGLTILDYESGYQTLPPTTSQATSMGLTSSAYGGSTGYAANLINAFKNSTQAQTMETVRHNNELALFPVGSMTNLYVFSSNPPWGFWSIPGSGGLYNTPDAFYRAMQGYNFLLKRDLDPASNDNDPMWLEKAA